MNNFARRVLLTVSVATLPTLAACGGGGGGDGGSSVPDTTPPTVSSTNPPGNATGVLVDGTITVTFSEPVAPASITANSFQLGGGKNPATVAGTRSVSGATVTFTPSAPLDYDASYGVTLTSAITDVAGNAMASYYNFTFSTESAPHGTLDTTFGSGGVAKVDLGGSDTAFDMVVLNDDRIVMVGARALGILALVRLNVDGSPDATFGGGDGIAAVTLGSGLRASIAVQSDGKYVVATDDGADWIVARFNTDGALDSTFGGGDGIVTTDFSGNDTAFAALIQADGKIVVGGQGAGKFALARYDSGGTLDPGFGTGGKATLATGVDAGTIQGIALQFGKIVAGGNVNTNNNNSDFAVARFNTDGTPDTTFGTSGYTKTDFAGDAPRALAIQADGKILLAGSVSVYHSSFAVARYAADGVIDSTFGVAGKAEADWGGKAVGEALVVQSDGKIVMAGAYGTNAEFALARFTSGGNLDTAFGNGGLVRTNVSSGNENLTAIGLQSNGTIVAAGWAINVNQEDFTAARYVP